MIMAKLSQNPKFQFLSSIAHQMGEAQMTALTGKKDATSAQVSLNLMRLSSTLQSQTVQANSQGLKTSTLHTSQGTHASHAPSNSAKAQETQDSDSTDNDSHAGGLGSTDPDAGSNSGGYGDAEQNSSGSQASHGNGYGAYATNNDPTKPKSNTSGPASDPSTWNTQDMEKNVLSYDRAMFHYFDMLQSSQMNNPQVIIAFVTALSKLASVQNAPLPNGKSYSPHFQAFLSSLSNLEIKVNGSNMPFGDALGYALAVAALYNQHSTGQDAQGFLNQITGQLGSTPGFIGQMAAFMQSGNALTDVNRNWNYAHMSDTTDGGKQLVSNVVESIGYGIQNNFAELRDGYMTSYENAIDEPSTKTQAGGASLYDMMNLVLMSYDQSDDYAASYSVPINDLGNAGNAGASLMQFLTPTGLTTTQARTGSPYCIVNGKLSDAQVNQDNQFMSAFDSMGQEWANTPSLQQSGVAASITAAHTKIGSIELPTLSWLNSLPTLRAAFSPADRAELKSLFSQLPSGTDDQSVNIGTLSTLIRNNPGQKQLLDKYLTAGLDFINSTSVDGATKVPSPNSQTQAAINSLQTLQSQISSVNQSAKAEFTNANQSAANLLSTVGGIEKNIVGMLNNIVQAQKF